MNDLILIKSGSLNGRNAMPKLNEGEFGYRTDTKELYIGADGKNVRLCGVGDAEKINALELRILTLEAQIEEITARLDAQTPSV
jgi:hypothetical protein